MAPRRDRMVVGCITNVSKMIKYIARTELHTHVYYKHIGDIMVSVLALSVVERGLEP